MTQKQVLAELRRAIDGARVADPVNGPNPHARRRIREIVRENPEAVRSFRVMYNLGRVRREWLLDLLTHDTGQTRGEILGVDSPWLDDVRANGPVLGGHADTGAEGSAADPETAKLERP